MRHIVRTLALTAGVALAAAAAANPAAARVGINLNFGVPYYVPPPPPPPAPYYYGPPARCWVPGHHNRRGYWIPGHYRPCY